MITAQPIVPNATCIVRCACGFADDSEADTPEVAIAEVRPTHSCGAPAFTAEMYTCDDCDHPLVLSKRIMFARHGVNFGLCRKCARAYLREARRE